MENDIALYATSYVAIRVAILAAIAYVFYRILRRGSSSAAVIETCPAEAKREITVRNDRY